MDRWPIVSLSSLHAAALSGTREHCCLHFLHFQALESTAVFCSGHPTHQHTPAYAAILHICKHQRTSLHAAALTGTRWQAHCCITHTHSQALEGKLTAALHSSTGLTQALPLLLLLPGGGTNGAGAEGGSLLWGSDHMVRVCYYVCLLWGLDAFA